MTNLNHRDYALQAFDWVLQHPLFPERGQRKYTVLDVGCRDESMRAPLEERGFTWTGVDLYPGTANVLQAKMEDMKIFPDNSYDLLFVCHAFEHCEHPIEALKEFLRILKPGGWVFIATPFPCRHHILQADEDHIFVLTPEQMIRLLVYTGYVVQDIKAGVHPGDIEQNHTVVTVGRKP